MAAATTVQTPVSNVDHAALPAPAARRKRAPRQPKTAPLNLFWVRRAAATHVVVEINAKGQTLSTHRIASWQDTQGSGSICTCGPFQFEKGKGRANCCSHLLALMAFERRDLAVLLTARNEHERAFTQTTLAQDYERDGHFRLILPELLKANPGCVSVKIASFTGGDKPYIVDFDRRGFADCGCPSYYSDHGSPRGTCKHIPFAREVLAAHGIAVGGGR